MNRFFPSRLFRFAAAVLVLAVVGYWSAAHAATTEKPGLWVLSPGSAISPGYATEADCVAAASVKPGVYSCSTAVQITVVADTGNATLRWAAPVFMADGVTPAALSGFKVYWGTVSHQYTSSQLVSDPLATSLVLNLPVGTAYVSITAIGTNGAESPFGFEVSKLIVAAP